MTTLADSDALKRGRRATTLAFLLIGILWGSWAPHIALVKERLDLTAGVLGLALLAAACGTLVALPLTGGLIARVGSGPLMRGLAAPVALTLLLPALAPNLALLFLGAGLLGAVSGALDIAMNAHGIAIETRLRRPIVSTLHACYSLGGLTGAGAAAVLLPLVGDRAHVIAVTVVLILLCLPVVRGALPASMDMGTGTRTLVLPSRAALGIGLLAFIALVGEGAVQDWSAVYLLENLATGAGVAALGFAAFSATMTIGRLAGDRLRARFADHRLLVASATVSAAGLAAGLLVPMPAAAIAGFGVMGLGMANMVPLLFVAGARVPGLAPSVGLAAVSTVGYSGFVFGPAVVGGVAEFAGLRWSLFLLAVGILAVAFVAPLFMHAGPRANTTA
jgi:MFS family permease